MAPLRNLPGRAAQPAKSVLKKTTVSNPSTERPEPLFTSTKRDKRLIKHARLMSKITKSTAKPHRRRPNKKLVATLNSLADALPDDVENGGPVPEGQVNIIKRKSIKSRPGAMKRREKLDKSERDRFAKNMAQMAGSTSGDAGVGTNGHAGVGASGTARWTALRGFISQTLEQRPDVQTTTG